MLLTHITSILLQVLNGYTNRVSHLLSRGRHLASAAVLYHAEAEWSAAWVPLHKPVKALIQSQIDEGPCHAYSAKPNV